MKTLPLTEVKAKLSQLVDAVEHGIQHVTITRHGRPAAMLVGPDEIANWEATAEILADPEFMASIRRGLADIKHGRTVTLAELDEFMGLSKKKASRRRGRT